VADARVALLELAAGVEGYRVAADHGAAVQTLRQEWEREVDRLFHLANQPTPAQSEVIGALWEATEPRDVLVSAAGSHPGELHKLWRTRSPGGYHLEYGYSCMGYEIPGAIGAKLADPSREVFAFVGDGTYLMMPTEIVTAMQERVKIIIVLVDNHGFASIGGLSQAVGSGGFGTHYRCRSAATGQLDGDRVAVDFAANARSLGAVALPAGNLEEFKAALKTARSLDRTSVIVVETEREVRVPGYESWWDVAVAEVSDNPAVQQARAGYEAARKLERHHL
jgi:3D-(3,5/4)-trihydroxycyclohexane-1,2-dione acylhydrolase (decyclizing)